MEGLKQVAANNGMPVSENIKKVEEGWEGKPTGLFQIFGREASKMVRTSQNH
jgi:hypothetical protein